MKLKTKIAAIIALLVIAAGVIVAVIACGNKHDDSVSESISSSVSASESVSESSGEPESDESESLTESKSDESVEHVHTGGTATCVKKAVCVECGKEYGDYAAHSFTAEVAEAKYIASAATCDGAATYYMSCAVCGEKGTETFAYGEALTKVYGEWVSNGDGTHTRTCVNGCNHTETADCSGGEATCAERATCEACGGKYGSTKAHNYVEKPTAANLKTAQTCTSGAVYYKSCSVCGEKSSATFTSGSGLGHNLGKAVANNDGTHTRTCVNGCNHTETADCSGGEATCTELAVCSACGGKYGSLAKHAYTAERAEAKYIANAATCDGAATYYMSCAVCGEKGTETFAHGEALTKVYGEWVSNGNGTHTRTCVNGCNHTETADCSGGEATCTEKAICDTCKKAYGAEPSHSWDDGIVTKRPTCIESGVKKYTCEKCTATKTEKLAEGHNYTETVVEPTCVEKGYTRHVCQNDCGNDYIDNEEPAAGHNWDKDAPTCTEDRICLTNGCGAKEAASGHVYVTETTDATCTAAAKRITTCSKCTKYHEEEEIGTPNGHTPVADATLNVLQNGKESCYYIKGYRCSVCREDITKEKNEEFETHSYVASIVSAATCTKDGEKKLTCKTCGFGKSESIEADTENGHNWGNGETDGNRITYTCQNTNESDDKCSATKTVLDASTQKEATVSKDDVASAGEVRLDGAEMKFDDTVKNQLGENVTVGATTLDEETVAGLNLTEAQKEQIGNNKIYNFTLSSDGAGVDFNGGTVKVTLPYTLASGEDVDSIAVWYINDAGELESYKATYFEVLGKGYVTFDAKHFSYYTVTRLTPEERCALYGHSYIEKIISKTCTENGYTLKVCVRCGNEEINDITTAEGHKYADTTKAATCDAKGSIVHVCSVCNANYTEIIPAKGHKWKLDVDEPATCGKAGVKKFVCENGCGESYTVTSEKLNHVIETTEIPVSCETAGYIEYKCKNCDYGYKHTTQNAKGHNYKAVWTWGEDYSATLKMVCANDEIHEVTVNATVETIEESATCINPERIVYRATGEFNGVVYRDEKSITEGEKADHAYSDYIAAADRHYKLCTVCGAEADSGEHTGTSEVIKNATCAASGEAVTVCDVCGYVKKEIIPATGKHYYVKGVCAYCGKVYSSCDHTELKFKFIDLGELGACAGMKIPVLACECGEKVVYDSNYSGAMIITCNLFDISAASSEDGKTAEGNDYQKGGFVCGICDCEYEMYLENIIVSECVEKYVGYIRAVKNGEVIFNAEIEQVDSNHRNTEYVEKDIHDFTDKNVCNGSLVYEKCLDCGEEDFYDVDLDCDISYDFDNAKEEITVDEDGFTHLSRYNECKICGLRLAQVYVYKEVSECVTVAVEKAVVSIDGDILAEVVFDYGATPAQHEFEVISSEIDGYDCYDGWKAIMRCKKCGTVSEYGGGSHMYGKEKTVTLPEGSCGGSVSYRECIICGCVDSPDVETKCEGLLGSTPETSEETVDGVKYTVDTSTCEKCGLMLIVKFASIKHSECVTENYNLAIILFDGEVIATLHDSDFRKNHDYETTYKLSEGQTCESSYEVIRTCKICGDIKTTYGFGHVRGYRTVELTGECGGTVDIRYCEICGEIEGYSWRYFGNPTYSSSKYTDDDGIEHEVETETCSVCGIKEVTDVKRILEDSTNCGWRVYTKRTLSYADGTIIVSFEEDYYRTDHKYEYSYAMKGETCEDGYTVIETCKICGKTDKYESEGHRKNYRTEELTGECGGTVNIKYCEICGEIEGYSWRYFGNHRATYSSSKYTDDDGIEHEVETETCSVCGIKEVTDVKRILEDSTNCGWRVYTKRTLYCADETIIVSCQGDYLTTNHEYGEYSYTMKGETCEDGYTATRTCKICHETDKYESEGHRTEYFTEEIEDNPCRGTIECNKCVVCGKVYKVGLSGNHSFTYDPDKTYTDDNGYEHTFTNKKCETCGISVTDDCWYAPNPNGELCEYLEYANRKIVSDAGEIIAESTWYYITTIHKYVYEYTFDNGKDCSDGCSYVATCSVCKETDSGYRSYHYWTSRTVELNGECGGEIEIGYCKVCDKVSSFNVYGNHIWGDYARSTVTDEKGVAHSIETRECSICGLKRIEEDWRELIGENPCEWNVYGKHSAVMGTETLAECVIINTADSHIWVYNFTLTGETCEDGWTAQRTCAICGKDGGENYGGWHNTRLVEYYDLSKNGACEGTYIAEYRCACGLISDVGWDLCSNCYRTSLDEIPPKDGELSHTKETFTCSDCGLKIEKDVVRVKTSDKEEHTCVITTTVTYNVSVNGKGICNLTTEDIDSAGHRYSDYTIVCKLKEGSKTCEDGITVIRTCADCGYTHTYESTSHRMFAKESFALNSVCGGTAYLMGCACGQVSDVRYDAKCDFESSWVEMWVENTVSGSYFQGFHGETWLEEKAWIKTCAVTDPERCAYKIRYAYYWLKNDDCTATNYRVWQFGYNEEKGTFDKEIVLKGKATYIWHDFEITTDNDETNRAYIETYTCKGCGSYYKYTRKYDEKGNRIEEKLEAVNNLDKGEFKTHTETRRFNENGNRTYFLCEWMDMEGTLHSSWEKITTNKIEVPAPFTSGYETITETNSYKGRSRYGIYKDRDFTLEEYHEETDEDGTVRYWRKIMYTYDFASCTRTCVYTNSDGERRESSETHFGGIGGREIKSPTCTQFGTGEEYCSLCEEVFGEYFIQPNGHNWRHVSDSLYICSSCGLMNKNGASGVIVMEDLTDYQNGEYYEVGYWLCESDKQFLKNVTLIRKNALGDENDEILLDMADADFAEGLNGVVSVRFLKSRAEELANLKLNELGLSMEDYNVRFSFVPRGFKDTLDYAITFEPVLSSYQTSGNGLFVCEIGAEIIITPTETLQFSFGMYFYGDFYIELYDSDETFIKKFWGSDSAILEAGKTYKLKMSGWTDGRYGVVRITSDCYGGSHLLNGKVTEAGGVLYFKNAEELAASGITIFGGTPNVGERAAGGFFRCDRCASNINVTVVIGAQESGEEQAA